MRDETPVVDEDERERVRPTSVGREERRGPTACGEHTDQERRPGGYSGYFADPDGFAWEVAWNPARRLAP
jgi:hypothetical protein